MSDESQSTKERVREFATKSTRKIRGRVRTLIFPRDKGNHPLESANLRKQESEPGKSTELPEDIIQSMIDSGDIIDPPFDLLQLAMLPEISTELGPSIAAMEINIEGFGHRLVPRIKPENASNKVKKEIEKERVLLENFFSYAAGIEDSFTKFRRKLRVDEESTGNAEFEVIRNAAGKIQQFNHLPSYQMYLTREEADPIKVKRPVYLKQSDGTIKVEQISIWKRFRKYVQTRYTVRGNLTVVGALEKRWFKEFGDPRVYDNRTGEEAKTTEDIAKLPEEQRANELIHLTIYSARTPYGLPRTIGVLLSIMGDRAQEETNFITLQSNNIPSMFICVSNGLITKETEDRLAEFAEANIQGSNNYSKFIVIEAEPSEDEGEDPGQMKIDVEPLTSVQHSDALFQKYSANNRDKIRRSFRLPPILTGQAESYTRATAEISRKVADEQIFSPERDEFDDMINRRILPDMGILYHTFKSNSPNTTDNTELVRILAGAEKTGGITPRIARNIIEDILGIELPEFPKDFPQDVPFSMTMAEAVKNLAQPGEPSQQFTSVKMLKIIDQLTKSDIPLFEASGDEIIDRLMQTRNQIETHWNEEIEKLADSHADEDAE